MDRFSELQALVAVVETGSFSRAGDRLGLAKSMVSRRVSQLEQRLGAQLLQRTTRSLSLTGAGQQFYERALRILTDLDDAEQSLADDASGLRGRIRLAAPLSFGLHHLRDALTGFMVQHPAIEVELDLNDREINLVEEGFDVALRIGELRDSTLIAKRLGTIRFVACAGPGYLAEHGTPTHPRDIASHTGLHYTNVPLSQAWQFDVGERKPLVVIPGIRLRANNGDVLAEAAAAGLGIVYGPTFIASRHIVAGDLVPILAGYRRAPVGIHAVFPPGRLLPRRLQVLTDFLRKRFGDRPEWDRPIDAAPR
ncbi:MAG: LysR family transcriptional regulator [Gammaproteobacteria bacterium]|nr:LysR family transcriptional regulator [Gammaproteobacteria bacterium]